ncbi:MAG TPA: hypothetical protein VKD72_03035 [Gemmataceae bacterium]|nr:hypothetical protein [Gemmataceae bacterium]
MVPKTLKYSAVMTCGVLVLISLFVLADDTKGDEPAPSGTWSKKDGELKIEFADKGVMKIAPHGDSTMIGIVCDYTVDKAGLVKAKVTGFEGKEEAQKHVAEKLPVGFKFSFKWTVKGNAAKLDDVSGDNVDLLKSHMEGEFEKK